MPASERYETEWEGMRLIVECRPNHWHVIVYEPAQCEVLYTAQRMNVASAKFAAVDFVAVGRFGPHHDLKRQVIAEMLVWERV